jgi:co-chaperonin GroES (HSP10)
MKRTETQSEASSDGEPRLFRPSKKALRERVEKLVPLSVHPGVFDLELWGRRILVLQVAAEEETQGGIFVPPTARRPMAAGYILNIGSDVGTPIKSDKHGMPYWVDPWELIGKKAIFGDYCGHDLHFRPYAGQRFETEYMVMTEYDIWAIEEPEESASVTRR